MTKKETQFKKGQSPWNKGKKFSPELRKKLSDSAKSRGQVPPSRKGIKMPAEAVEKMKGRPAWNKGIKTGPAWNKGLKGVFKQSLETRKKMSMTHKNRLTRRNWAGWSDLYHFIRNCFEYRLWRSDVFHRDDFTCQECRDRRGGNLQADHIKPFAQILRDNDIRTVEQAMACEELWDLNNGRTLCVPCHRKTSTWGYRARAVNKNKNE